MGGRIVLRDRILESISSCFVVSQLEVVPYSHVNFIGGGVMKSMRFLNSAARWSGNRRGPKVSRYSRMVCAGWKGGSVWFGGARDTLDIALALRRAAVKGETGSSLDSAAVSEGTLCSSQYSSSGDRS
jgi:hypothetical protein